MNNIMENFQWLQGLDSFKTLDASGKTIRIKGIAAKAGDISRNGRLYLGEELKKSVSSMVKGYVTINHKNTEKVGRVIWADYENDQLEYLAEIWKEPYVSLLRSKSATIKGVSIDANYLFLECAQCHKKFESQEAWANHRDKVEHIHEGLETPHGIVYNDCALSLVLSPECPGIADTTIMIAETQNGFSRLMETVIKDYTERENMSQKQQVVKEKQTGPPYEHKQAIVKEEAPKLETKPEDKEEKPKVYDSMEACVKDGHTEEECKGMMKQTDKPEDVMTETRKPKPIKPLMKETAPRLKLGEPFSAYTDFEDCVNKNSDKEDPEAYCGKIKHETEETVHTQKLVTEKLNEVIEAWNNLKFPVDDKSWMPRITQLQETVKAEVQKFTEYINGLPKDDDSWKTLIVEKDRTHKEAVDKLKEMFDKRIAELPKDDVSWKLLIETIPKDDVSWKEGITKLQETISNATKTLTETLTAIPKEEWKQPLQEAINTIPKDDLGWKETKPYDDTAIRELISKIPVYDDAPIKLLLTNELEKNHVEIASLKETVVNQKKEWDAGIALADKNNGELRGSLDEMKKAKDKEIQELNNKLKETAEANDKKIKETEGLVARVDNLEDKQQHGTFKGKNKDLKPKGEISTFTPYGK